MLNSLERLMSEKDNKNALCPRINFYTLNIRDDLNSVRD